MLCHRVALGENSSPIVKCSFKRVFYIDCWLPFGVRVQMRDISDEQGYIYGAQTGRIPAHLNGSWGISKQYIQEFSNWARATRSYIVCLSRLPSLRDGKHCVSNIFYRQKISLSLQIADRQYWFRHTLF